MSWVRLWARVEHPRSLASVRILLGFVLFVEFVQIGRLELVLPLFATQQEGGWVEFSGTVLHWMGPTLSYGSLVLGSFCLMVGFCSRFSALVLLLVWARLGAANPLATRAIDLLCRDVLCILVFSGAGAWGSIDARIRTGSWWGDGKAIGAWARYLLIAQIVVLYFTAGLQKTDASWWFWGDLTALFVILQDPAVTRFSFDGLRSGGWRITQFLTAFTVLWQLAYPLMLLTLQTRFHWVWVGIGLGFHLGLAATMELGLFPWGMMALYPALIAPHHWARQ